jgi:hypothetical protein
MLEGPNHTERTAAMAYPADFWQSSGILDDLAEVLCSPVSHLVAGYMT